jgi:prepilin peptidase CpaA
MLTAAILVIFPLCMAITAFSDLFTMTIPNRVSIILIAGFLLIAPFTGLGLVEIGYHLIAGLIVFAIVFALFAFNAMGGGDAKVLTASAIWFGFNPSLINYMANVAFLGGALTILILILRAKENLISYVGLPVPEHLLHSQRIPYGIAIGMAAFLSYPQSPLVQIALQG